MEWYLKAVRNYAGFSGRARRREYWMFALFNAIIVFVLAMIDRVVFGADTPVLSGLYTLAVVIPSVAVAVRRLHDTGRSAWWLLVGLVPVVGGIILLVFYLLDSDAGPNEYGPSPKYRTSDATT